MFNSPSPPAAAYNVGCDARYPDAQRTLTPATEVPALQRVQLDLEELTAGVSAAHERAKQLADRLLGRRPENLPDKPDPVLGRSDERSAVDSLRQLLGKLRVSVNATHDELQRLESLW